MGALTETGAEEGGVNGKQDPAPTLEKDGREEETDPEGNFETGDNGHGGVIVLLDKGADGIGERMRGVGGLYTVGAWGGLGSRGDGRNDRRAGVGREVEDGVDEVREHGDRVLGGEEPDKGHDYSGKFKSVECNMARASKSPQEPA